MNLKWLKFKLTCLIFFYFDFYRLTIDWLTIWVAKRSWSGHSTVKRAMRFGGHRGLDTAARRSKRLQLGNCAAWLLNQGAVHGLIARSRRLWQGDALPSWSTTGMARSQSSWVAAASQVSRVRSWPISHLFFY